MTSEPTFATLLRDYRLRTGLSMMKLGISAGFHQQSYISRLEAGLRKPTPGAVNAVATALGLCAADAASLTVAAGYWPGDEGACLVLDARGALVRFVVEAEIASAVDRAEGWTVEPCQAARAAGLGNKWE